MLGSPQQAKLHHLGLALVEARQFIELLHQFLDSGLGRRGTGVEVGERHPQPVAAPFLRAAPPLVVRSAASITLVVKTKK